MNATPLTPHPSPSYTGRFAPSPTGPLHFGSLIAALGSFLDARTHRGRWLVRIEDLDPPREQPGAADAILRGLEAHGLYWDGAVLYQHERLDAYAAAITTLSAAGWAYLCACSRREIADSGVRGLEGAVYPGTCRAGLPPGKTAHSLRIRIPDDEACSISVEDGLQGTIRQDLAKEIGDFVIRRADGYSAYQLAVVVDDAYQDVTHVVRGADLLLSTPRQVYLQRRLGLQTPFYMHLSTATDTAGEKLSKQTGAAPLDDAEAGKNLFLALEFMQQSPPSELSRATPSNLLHWATLHWRPLRMRHRTVAPSETLV